MVRCHFQAKSMHSDVIFHCKFLHFRCFGCKWTAVLSFVAPCHLHNNGNTNSRTGWLRVNLLLNMEYHGIAHYLAKFLFSGERGTFNWGKQSCKGSLMSRTALTSLPKHSSMSKDAAWDVGKVDKHLPINKRKKDSRHLQKNKNTERIIFPNYFHGSGVLQILQRDVNLTRRYVQRPLAV